MIDILESLDWHYQASSPTKIRSGWKGQFHYFPLTIQIESSLVSLNVGPLFNIDFIPDEKKIYSLLNTLNQDLKFCKLYICPESLLNLKCEISDFNLSEDSFEHAIGILDYYANILPEQLRPQFTESGVWQFN